VHIIVYFVSISLSIGCQDRPRNDLNLDMHTQ